MKVMALRYLKTLFFILLFAVFFSWQAAMAQDPLTIEGSPAEVVFQDGTYKFIPEIKGGDGNYTFDYLNEPGWMDVIVVDGVNGSIILQNKVDRPDNGDVGVPDNPIKIWVKDGTGTQVFLPDFKVIVENKNDSPTIDNKGYDPEDPEADHFHSIPLNQLQILGGDTVEKEALFTLKVTDDDLDLGDELTFPDTGIPGWLEYVDDDGDGIPTLFRKEGRPDNSDAGTTYDLKLIVADNYGGSDLMNIKIEVSNVNDPPTVKFDPQPEDTVNQDSEWTALIKGDDVDFGKNDTEALTFSVQIYEIEGEGDTVTETLVQTLADDAEPTAPDYWLKSFLKDADDQDTGRILSGTPKYDNIGKYKIFLKATDASSAASISPTLEEAFVLEVINVNDPPTIEGDPVVTELSQADVDETTGQPKEVLPGAVFSFQPTADDKDGDVLTLTAKNLPDWLEFVDTDDNQIPDTLRNTENRPKNSDVGIFSGIELCADDNAVDSIDPVCMPLPDIEVTDMNDAPSIQEDSKKPDTTTVLQAYFAGGTVNPGEEFNFKPEFNDPDGDILTVTVNGNIPDWLEFVDDTLRNKQNRPDNNDPDLLAETLTICATDQIADAVCTDSFIITVEKVNDPPTLTSAKPQDSVDQSYGTCCVDAETEDPLPVAQGSIINFPVKLDDIDNDFADLKCFIENKPAWLELIIAQDPDTDTDNYFMVNSENRPANSDVGTYTGIQICVSDEEAEPVCTDEFTITVNNVNDPPTITGTPNSNVKQVIEDTAEGEEYIYPDPDEYDLLEISDPDLELENTQENLIYYLKNKPDWLTFKEGNLPIVNKENRPNQDDVGDYEGFQICVKDQDGKEACTDEIIIKVGDENDPPTIMPATDNDPVTKIDCDEDGGEYSSSFLIDDIDEDILTVWIKGEKPSWLDHPTIGEDKTTVTLEGELLDCKDLKDVYEIQLAVTDDNATTIYPFEIQVISPTPGDINYDGSVDITDAVLALQILAGLTPDNAVISGDANGDNKIGVEDILYILRRIVLQPANISAAGAKDLIGTTPDLVIIDVSTMYDQGHLPLARNYPVNDETLATEIPNLDKNGNYLVYCHTDSASLKAAHMLLSEGFKNVYRLEGNYDAWVSAGYLVDIPAAKAKELIDNDTDESLIIIDVAPGDTYALGYIPGAATYPLDALDSVISNLPTDKKYLVYCRSDQPSIDGGNKLVDAGFNPVYRLSGNLQAWDVLGYEIIKP